MLLTKVKGSNTFEWKICKTDKTSCDWYWSGYFAIYEEYEFYIECKRVLYDKPQKLMYQFYLQFDEDWTCPISYTFSILDRAGHVFRTSKGKVLRKEELEERLLSIIDFSYLKAYNLIENGAFTVRFSFHHELEAQEGSHPTKEEASSVADNSTNTSLLVTKDNSTNTDGEDTDLLETLSNNFSTFYENKMDTDCILRVSDIQFHVHRAILSARSSVFSAMFHHDTVENRSGEVDILDIKATALGDVLYYIYSGKIRGLTANTAASMYTAADKYDLCELRSKCFEFLKSNLTLDNFCEVALLAHTHGEMELEERVVSFIEENLDEILESSIWQQFLKDKTLLASKLLMSGFKVSKKKLRNITSK